MVRAIMIIEIAGRPAEHVKKSLEDYTMTLNDIKDIEVHTIKVSEPKEIDNPEDKKGDNAEKMFTCFAEVDFETENFTRLSETMFDFMPSSVEVIEPSSINFGTHDATDLLNNISGRLHRYDEISKIAHGRINELNYKLSLAHKLLLENKIIDSEGKILKKPKAVKKEKNSSKAKKKESKAKKKSVKKKAKK